MFSCKLNVHASVWMISHSFRVQNRKLCVKKWYLEEEACGLSEFSRTGNLSEFRVDLATSPHVPAGKCCYLSALPHNHSIDHVTGLFATCLSGVGQNFGRRGGTSSRKYRKLFLR